MAEVATNITEAAKAGEALNNSQNAAQAAGATA